MIGIPGGVRSLAALAVKAVPSVPTPRRPGPRPPRSAGALTFEVRSVRALTDDAVAIELGLPAGVAPTHRPGQHLTLTVPLPGGDVQRCYSLCGHPDDTTVTIGVKRTGGPASTWLHEQAAPGLALRSTRPSGTFVPHDLDADLLLLAAGSGITPVLGIARWALARGTGRVTVVYVNRAPGTTMFAGDLATLADTHRKRFELVSWFDDDRGLPQAATLAAEVDGRVDGREILVCGPPPFLDVVDGAMERLGVPASRAKRERFTFGEPRTTAVDDVPSGPPTEAVLSVRGTDARLDWPRGTVLLDRMIEADIDIPYVCRSGYCGGCVFTLTSGDVTMLDNSTLDGTDLAEGRRLACQSLPVTDTVGARFDD